MTAFIGVWRVTAMRMRGWSPTIRAKDMEENVEDASVDELELNGNGIGSVTFCDA